MQAFCLLTVLEREVLEAHSSGVRNSEIASRLRLSVRTVRNHVSAVLLKLQVPDCTAAALRARKSGPGCP